MFKQISILAVLCAAPAAGFAAVLGGSYTYCSQNGDGIWVCDPVVWSQQSVGSDGALNYVDTTSNSLAIMSGGGLILGDGSQNNGNALVVSESVYLEGIAGTTDPSDPDGILYIENSATASFSITANGNVNIAQNLNVGAGRALLLGVGNLSNVSIGSISNLGGLEISGNINILNVGTTSGSVFTGGAVTTNGDMTLGAATINTGVITNNSGSTSITATGVLTMDDFISNSAGTSAISADSISFGNIQNNSGAGAMTISAATSMTGTGGIQNLSDALVTINGGAVTAQTITNSSNNGEILMNVASLTLTGGNGFNASFVNKGDLDVTVAGATTLAYGFDLSGMANTNKFSLKTGTLAFGNQASADAWLALFSNRLNLFTVAITGGDIGSASAPLSMIKNGEGNTAGVMNLTSMSVYADSVLNAGQQLNVTSTNASGGIYVGTTVTNNLGSMTMASSGALNVTGGVTNDATMTLNGNAVTLNSVENEGILKISGLTDATGTIKVTGSVVNTVGTTTINARQIDIDGTLTNIAGITNISGSDSAGNGIAVGDINVAGGVVNLDATIGKIIVDNAISVNGGGLNFGPNSKSVTAGDSITISGNVTASGADATDAGNGDVNIAAVGPQGFSMTSTNGNITIYGDVSVIDSNTARTVVLDSKAAVDIAGNVTAGGQGRLTFGDTLAPGGVSATNLTVGGQLVSNAGGIVDLNIGNVSVGSLSGAGRFNATGAIIKATSAIDNAINIQNGIWFDGTNQNATSGFIVTGTSDLSLVTSGAGADINVAGGIAIGGGNTLTLNSSDQVAVSGAVTNAGTLNVTKATSVSFVNAINNASTLSVDGTALGGSIASITANGITNSGTATLKTSGALTTGAITNSGAMTANANSIVATAINSTAGSLDVTANMLNMTLLNVTGGYVNLNMDNVFATVSISATGDLVQGAATGMLNLTKNNTTLFANNLTIGGDFIANQYSVKYDVVSVFTVTGNMTVAFGATVDVDPNTISIDDVTNNGTLLLTADSVDLGDVVNSDSLTINSANILTVNSFTTNSTSGTTLTGIGLTSAGNIELAGRLMQNASGTTGSGDVNVVANSYTVNATSIIANGINQKSGIMTLNTSDLKIGERDSVSGNITKIGSIIATDLRVAAAGANWLNVDVTGSVSGGVDFIGLERMTVGGNYIFDDDSILMAAILDRSVTAHNYWATVSLSDDKTLGQITNGANPEPLISINGKFISQMDFDNPNMYYDWNDKTVGDVMDGQMGVYITDIVDQGSAIWLIHADGGIEDDGKKLRNAVVRFCNADGSICYNYMDSLRQGSANENDLPIYLSARDTDGDGEADSWYLVFDPRFGGPVELFKIQPIVGREDIHTDGEYFTAGALDDLLAGRMNQTGFYNRTPIELVPIVFENTNLETMSRELYDRMEQYVLDRNGAALARFSRLFQPREIEQVAGAVALNEHTTFRDFEYRMFDEFIWNRNRSLKKAWVDVDFGAWNQNVSDGKRVDGERFSIQGGFDWQDSKTLILGIAGHISHMAGSNWDEMDLGYKPGKSIAGRMDVDVATTNIGMGGYLMNTLGTGARLYGNAFLDLHLFDIIRDQNFVSTINGSGTAFSIITEWGLLHDWLNQYIVGNAYVRAGYNFGFDITEQADGGDYMKLESAGYMILTPGYSLTAQKRIYTSPWFQIRPYLSVGAEYDMLGIPDAAQFKFAYANKFTDYDINIDPLWVNGGGGMEFLGASGFQFGVDYRYQHNADIQMHKIKLSGSYRF
ncbi:MAG: hypothetical protein LBJ73_01980 [Rickettsiales bacterium]|jgi:hypothetical protein|nr:hypothetical protein [Rickettsiales bacterium]